METTTTWFSLDHYYNIIELPGRRCLLLGEEGERWTEAIIDLFEDAGIKLYLFSWSKSIDIRLELELVSYPFLQVWRDGSLYKEVIGYNNDDYQRLLQKIKKDINYG